LVHIVEFVHETGWVVRHGDVGCWGLWRCWGEVMFKGSRMRFFGCLGRSRIGGGPGTA